MPEGPEIRRAVDKIAKALVNQPVSDIFFAFDHLKSFEDELRGQTITAVESRGKAVLTRFEGPLNIYSHNQLYGIWKVCKAGEIPDSKRQLRLAIHNARHSALLYSASDIEVLYDHELADHPFLKRLGPDVLDPSTELDTVIERFRDKRFSGKSLGSLLLDQHFLAGLGNYLRTEILHLSGLRAEQRPKNLSDAAVNRISEATLDLTRRSYQTGGITNDPERVKALKASGFTRRQYRFFAFDREGQPCYTCGAPIEKGASGSRRIYWCPVCQAGGE